MTATATVDIYEISARAKAALEAGDIEAIDQMYASDALVTHYFESDQPKPWSEIRKTLNGIFAHTKARALKNVRITPIDGGFVQQQDLVLTNAEDVSRTIHAALIYKINAEGKIVSLEEYLDPRNLHG